MQCTSILMDSQKAASKMIVISMWSGGTMESSLTLEWRGMEGDGDGWIALGITSLMTQRGPSNVSKTFVLMYTHICVHTLHISRLMMVSCKAMQEAVVYDD